MFKWTLANTCWLGAYLLVVGIVVVGLYSYRAAAIAKYGTEQASADWQAWRDGAAEMSKAGPVSRRMPAATAPPALLLMRDHFFACLFISWLLSSCLFGWFMLSIRGAFRSAVIHDDPVDGGRS